MDVYEAVRLTIGDRASPYLAQFIIVANRVSEIHQKTSPSQWRQVPRQNNCADDAMRGLDADEMARTLSLSRTILQLDRGVESDRMGSTVCISSQKS
jgi:hypothetical protein